MADVYRYKENVLDCYAYGMEYIGFENGQERDIKKDPLKVFGHTIMPGSKITALDSGSDRTSFKIDDTYIVFAGLYDGHALFEIEEETAEVVQGSLFDEPKPPKWFLAMAYVSETAGLLMFSQPGACYDIRPLNVVYTDNKQ
ncbi:hypothetical protein C8N47_111102 [Mangrovibacterium marinum]|uniref:Uncharacterized protein n=1 Tax=Mangrovibacterium marinum TaxID=1639118 RepID=A0A2T5C0G5_9BACT|nr:hypothetical protein [Mangrovibacterium marinum]PTN08062.1 hypothetical protein C8N47_111102 [Mangrovibacterium marinum]